MMRWVFSFSAIFLFLLTSPALAMSFSEAYKQLLLRNVAYQQARVELKASQTLITQARGGLLPSVQATVTSGYIDGKNFEDTLSQDQYDLSLRQPIYNRVAITAYQQAKSRVLEAELGAQRILEEQLLLLSDAYFSFMEASANINVSQREISAIQGHLEQTKARLAIGLDTLADVHEASSRIEVAKVRLSADVQSQKQAVTLLRQLVQLDLNNLNVSKVDVDALNRSFKEQDVVVLIDEHIEQNNEVKLNRQTLESADLSVKRDKADLLPTVDLTARLTQTDTEGQFGFSDNTSRNESLRLELNIPLFSGFQKTAKARESKYLYVAEKLSLKNTILTQTTNILIIYGLQKTAFEKMKGLEKAFKSASEVVTLRKESYLLAIGSNLDVLNAYQNMHNRERFWLSAMFEYLSELVRLKVTLGKFDIESSNEIDELML
jgi:outer membrane protein TolC